VSDRSTSSRIDDVVCAVGYSKNALTVNFAGNFTDAQAPNLLLTDPSTGKPLFLDFKTQSYDIEAGDTRTFGTQQVVTFGGNVRQNNFTLSIAPNAQTGLNSAATRRTKS